MCASVRFPGVPHAIGSGLGALCAHVAEWLAGRAVWREGAASFQFEISKCAVLDPAFS